MVGAYLVDDDDWLTFLVETSTVLCSNQKLDIFPSTFAMCFASYLSLDALASRMPFASAVNDHCTEQILMVNPNVCFVRAIHWYRLALPAMLLYLLMWNVLWIWPAHLLPFSMMHWFVARLLLFVDLQSAIFEWLLQLKWRF